MRVFIAGIDGYLGWPLALHLAVRGHDVSGADGFFRRRWVEEMGSWSATPIDSIDARLQALYEHFGKRVSFLQLDLRDIGALTRCLAAVRPDAVVHLGECPSAPYSMIDAEHAVFVQTNNLTTTLNVLFAMREACPDAHLVKLGTMGEYGTPNLAIPEGFFEVEYRGRRDRLPFPRQAGSWYHWSKVHDSHNVMFACQLWGLRATDVMQGIVFGTQIDGVPDDERLLTRLDFDQAFGTVVNRFCCQAVIGHPLTVYGAGYQRRGFLPLRDSMQCLTLILERPPQPGEYRVINQFDGVMDLQQLARAVERVAVSLGLDVAVRSLENPRREREDHYYCPDRSKLTQLGYRPSADLDTELRGMLQDLSKHRQRIEDRREVLVPDVRWEGRRAKARVRADHRRVDVPRSPEPQPDDAPSQHDQSPAPSRAVASRAGESAFQESCKLPQTASRSRPHGDDAESSSAPGKLLPS